MSRAKTVKRGSITLGIAMALALLSASAARAAHNQGAFLTNVTNVVNANTVPANGDLNPYGVAFVPADRGLLKRGNILVSNFNNSANQQGTGTTIVQIDKGGAQSLFFQGTGLGLTTALGVLPGDLVVVGSLPATYDSMGNLLSIGQGSLLIISPSGVMIDNLSSATLLDGPWDLAVDSVGNQAFVFVSNVLSGTVTRIDLTVKKGTPTIDSMTQIASGYLARTDPTALVVGPTGLAFDSNTGLLYVCSTGDNEVFSIPNAETATNDAGQGTLVYSDPNHLHGPLALVMAPNGNLLASQGDAVNPDPSHNSEIVEFTPGGSFVAERQVDMAAGAAFGMAISRDGRRFAAVDDNTNELGIFVDAHHQ